MSYRWVEHTGELELEIYAATEAAAFAEALAAMAELLGDEHPRGGESRRAQVALTGRDRAVLLADWLDELVFRAETEGLVPVSIDRLDLTDEGLLAEVELVPGSPRPLVKGVTHHGLEFEPSGPGFRATVVLDV